MSSIPLQSNLRQRSSPLALSLTEPGEHAVRKHGSKAKQQPTECRTILRRAVGQTSRSLAHTKSSPIAVSYNAIRSVSWLLARACHAFGWPLNTASASGVTLSRSSSRLALTQQVWPTALTVHRCGQDVEHGFAVYCMATSL